MSDLCHICGPVKHEAPTMICAPCALISSVSLIEIIDSAAARFDKLPLYRASHGARAEIASRSR